MPRQSHRATPALGDGEARAALMMRLRRSGIRSLAVLRAMEAVPRQLFLPAHLAAYAVRDLALPIGCGQTSPRPSFVARALEALDCGGDESVLEIGSGGGFVTALLAKLARRVDGVERFRTLAEGACERLNALGLDTACVRWGDGLAPAWAAASFDRIVLHVAVAAPPPSALDRLAPGGVLVYPRGCGPQQTLVRASRTEGGDLKETVICLSQVAPPMAGRSASL